MGEVKTLLATYWTWVALASGALLGVWWAKMTPATANITLGIGVIAAGVAVFLQPWVAAHPLLIRVFWSLAVSSILALTVYYTLWDKSWPPMPIASDAAALSTPAPSDTPSIKTLYDLYLADCKPPEGFQLHGTRMLTDHDKPAYEVKYFICADLISRSKYIHFFLPESDYTFSACKFLPAVYRDIMEKDSGMFSSIKQQRPSEREESAADLKDSGRVFVYHESYLLPSRVDELTEEYIKVGLSPQFRGRDYQIMRNSPLYPDKPTPSAAQQEHSTPNVITHAYLGPTDAPYPKGTILGGISWEERYTDVRLDIANGPVPIRNLDLTIGLDTHIEAIGQLSGLPNVTLLPFTSAPGIWLGGTDAKGNRVNYPLTLAVSGPAGSPQYRIHCSDIFRDSTLQLVIAAVVVNAPSPKGELPNQLFGPKRAPQLIQIKGTYETSGVDGTSRYTIDSSHRFISSEQPLPATAISPSELEITFEPRSPFISDTVGNSGIQYKTRTVAVTSPVAGKTSLKIPMLSIGKANYPNVYLRPIPDQPDELEAGETGYWYVVQMNTHENEIRLMRKGNEKYSLGTATQFVVEARCKDLVTRKLVTARIESNDLQFQLHNA